jgi:hypothetical protein
MMIMIVTHRMKCYRIIHFKGSSYTEGMNGDKLASFMSWQLFPQGKGPWDPLDRRLGGPYSQLGHPYPYQEPNPSSLITQPVA